jgi:hypothetical protein
MVDASWRIQSNSGTVDPAATSAPVTLPAPASDQSTLMLFIASSGITPNYLSLDPPWFVDQQHAGQWLAWRRPGQPAGETSWTVTAAGAIRWAWYIEEWAGLSGMTQPDSQSAIKISAGMQVNNTSTVTQAAPDVTDYRAVALYRSSGGTGLFPAGHTYDAGWSEVSAQSVGTGASTTDFMLMIAEAYLGTTGAIDCSLTWDITGGGTYTDKTVDVWVAAYQPAAPPQPADVLTT